MAINQKLTLTQLESESSAYRVRVVWTSTQTPPSYNNVSHVGYLYYRVNDKEETTVSVKYKLPPDTEQTILDTVLEIPIAGMEPVTLQVRTWMDTHLNAGVIKLTESLELMPPASTVTAGDGVIGSVTAVKIHRGREEYTHSVRYVFGTQSGYLTESGGISSDEAILTSEEIPFLIPDSFYAEIPNDREGVCTLYCTTYSGGVQVGETQQTAFTVTVDEASCMPSVTGTVEDVNEKTLALTGDETVFVRYHSDALCALTPQAKHGASVAKMWIDGIELTDGNSLTISAIQQEYVVFYVQDSRGFTNISFSDYILIPYTHLTSTPTVTRDNPTSGNATLSVTGLCFDGSFGAVENELSFAYQIDGGEWIPAQIEYTVTDGRYYGEIKLTGLDYRKVFNITVRVSDCLETVEKKLTLKKGIPVFDWGEADFAFHVPVQMEDGLDVAGELRVGGKKLLDWIYPIGSVYATVTAQDPSALLGGQWERLDSTETAVIHWKRIS